MLRIDVLFLLLATLSLTVGVSMGIGMGIAHDFQFAPVHAHLNLVGWASLALYGLAYRAYPALKRSRLGPAHLIAATLGAVLFPIGLYLAIAHDTVGLAIMGSLIWLAGVLIFLLNLVWTVVLGSPTGMAVRRGEAVCGETDTGFGPVLSENVR
jgi:cbb3-type cytochrome oxidase subunit 1